MKPLENLKLVRKDFKNRLLAARIVHELKHVLILVSRTLNNNPLSTPHRVIHEHSQLCGTSKTAAVSQFLYTVSALRQYGMEPYSVKLDVAASTAQINNNNTTTTTQQGQQTDGRSSPSKQATLEEIKFCIGPRGLEIIDQSNTERKL